MYVLPSLDHQAWDVAGCSTVSVAIARRLLTILHAMGMHTATRKVYLHTAALLRLLRAHHGPRSVVVDCPVQALMPALPEELEEDELDEGAGGGKRMSLPTFRRRKPAAADRTPEDETLRDVSCRSCLDGCQSTAGQGAGTVRDMCGGITVL